MAGKFIVFEGTDGCGKSTQLKLTEEFLQSRGIEFVLLREPGGTEIGERVREILLDSRYNNMTSETEALLYAASRAQLVKEKILPNLEAGKLVLADRFVMSSLAYQGVARGLGIQRIMEINRFGIGDLSPDRIFFLDLSPEKALARKRAEAVLDRLESETQSFHQRVYDGYMKIIESYSENVVVLDVDRSPEEVFSELSKELLKIIEG